jgi:hypothetical protein
MKLQKLIQEINNPSKPLLAFIIYVIIGSIGGIITFATKNIFWGIGIACSFILFLALIDYLAKRYKNQSKEQIHKEATLPFAQQADNQSQPEDQQEEVKAEEPFEDLKVPLNQPPMEPSNIRQLDFSRVDQFMTDEELEELKNKHPDLSFDLNTLWVSLRIQKLVLIVRLTAKQMGERWQESLDHLCSWKDLERQVQIFNQDLESATKIYFPEPLPSREKTGS